MKKLLITSGVIGLATAGLIAIPSFVQAQGGSSNGMGYGYEQQLTTKAKILNMTKDQLQTQLKTKTFDQIAEDKGISQDQLHQKIQAAATERWKSRGLSQDEINTRLKEMQQRQANCDGTHENAGTGQMHSHGQNR